MDSRLSMVSATALAAAVTACGSSGSTAMSTEYRVVAVDGTMPTANEGEALRLSVVQVQAGGTMTALPTTATVIWSGPPLITALPEGSPAPAESSLPQPGASATGMWVRNPDHLTDAQVNGVLYVIDKGTAPNPSIAVTATVGGGAPAGQATATIPVAAFPAGDATRGQKLFTDNCASCHGAQGEGTTLGPVLNASVDSQGNPNVAADPSWPGPMFAITPLSNMDNDGISLAVSMPRWLITDTRSGQLLTTQNLSDVYVFLKTQTDP